MQNAYEMGKKTITKKYPNKSSDIATCGTRSGVRTLDTLIKSGTRCVLFIFIVIYLRPFNHVKMALHSHLFMFILYKKGFLKNT